MGASGKIDQGERGRGDRRPSKEDNEQDFEHLILKHQILKTKLYDMFVAKTAE